MSQYDSSYLAFLRERNLYTYDMLSADAQGAARQNIIATEAACFSADVKKTVLQAKADIHGAVNNPRHIRHLVERYQLIRRLQRDPSKLERFVLSNLCEFDAAGRYRPHYVVPTNVAAANVREMDPQRAPDLDFEPG